MGFQFLSFTAGFTTMVAANYYIQIQLFDRRHLIENVLNKNYKETVEGRQQLGNLLKEEYMRQRNPTPNPIDPRSYITAHDIKTATEKAVNTINDLSVQFYHFVENLKNGK